MKKRKKKVIIKGISNFRKKLLFLSVSIYLFSCTFNKGTGGFQHNEGVVLCDLLNKIIPTNINNVIISDSTVNPIMGSFQLSQQFIQELRKQNAVSLYFKYDSLNFTKVPTDFKILKKSRCLKKQVFSLLEFQNKIKIKNTLDSLCKFNAIYVSFSRIMYDKTYKSCLIYVEQFYNGLDASGYLYFMQFIDGYWTIVAKNPIHIS